MKNKIQLLLFCLIALGLLILLPRLNTKSNEVLPEINEPLHTLVINEVVSNNATIIADETGVFSDYIELYNTGDVAIMLKGYGLSDDPSTPLKWTFPEVTLEPKGYLVVFASNAIGSGATLHTNFKLSENGDKLSLADPNGVIIQALPLADTTYNMSYSLTEKGTYVYYTTGTPGALNEGIVITDLTAYKESYQITFSQVAGFYDEPIDVSLKLTQSSPQENITLRYTLDGTDPTIDSPIYQEALHITARDADPLLYANQQATFYASYSPKPQDVFKGTLVKAQTFLGDLPIGNPATHTYFITSAGASRYSFPVISLSTDPDNLYDDVRGIFVVGSAFEKIAGPNPDGSTPANYNQRGAKWERPIHMEYIDQTGKSVFEQDLGVRTLGGWSRANPKKSLRLFARDSYADDGQTMAYPFFTGLTDKSGTSIESFSRLLLRSGGNDWEIGLFRDPLMQSLVSDTLDTQASEATVVFINGEYWGIYFLNESLDSRYVESHYEIPRDDVAIINYNLQLELFEGIDTDLTDYNEMITFLKENDMTTEANYAYANTLIDMDNLIEYFTSEIYFCNTDWPGNNIKIWRKRTPTYQPDAPYGQDGRYRFMVYDTDFGFGLYEGMSFPSHKTIAFATATGGSEWPNPDWSTVILRTLMTNKTFKQQFINVLCDNLNTRFESSVVTKQIDYYRDLLKPEIDEYAKRYQMWAIPNEESWEDNTLAPIYDFAKKRPDFLRLEMLSYFKLESAVDVTISENAPQMGSVRLNDHVDVLDDDAVNTFNGMYFKNVPMTVFAQVKPGYRFVGWSGDVKNTEVLLTLTPDADLNITANYEKE